MLIRIESYEQTCLGAGEEIEGGIFKRCFELPCILAIHCLVAFDLDVGIELMQSEIPMNVCAALYIR